MEILRIPKKVYYGNGSLHQLAEVCAGKHVAMLSDKGVAAAGVTDLAIAAIGDAAQRITLLNDIPAEPTYAEAQVFSDACRECEPDLLVAIGGGSVMDVAKLCSITMDGSISVHDLLKPNAVCHKIVPTVMIPTTAGTGAEATPNAIVLVPEESLKVGIVQENMLPDIVILDGATLETLPSGIAASTGIDALCHSLECYTSNKANVLSDLYAMESMKLIFDNIEAACSGSHSPQAKDAMLLAAFYGGVAITCSGTTAVHALSYPLGGRYHIPHGIANAMMLLPVMRFNKPAITAELSQIALAVGLSQDGTVDGLAEAVLDRIEEMLVHLHIPTSLAPYGVSAEDLPLLVSSGMQVTRLLNNNRRPLTAEDAADIYLQLLSTGA